MLIVVLRVLLLVGVTAEKPRFTVVRNHYKALSHAGALEDASSSSSPYPRGRRSTYERLRAAMKKLSPKTEYFARRSFLQLALASVAVIAMFVAAAAELVPPLVPFGLLALAILVAEFEKKRLIAPFARRKVCELGADGLLAGDRFIPWRDVVSMEKQEGDVGKGESASYVRRAVVTLRGADAPMHLEPFNLDVFLEEVAVRSKEAAAPEESPETNYRVTSAPTKETCVRVAIDGAVPAEERRVALERLDEHERELLRDALVDPRVRENER